MKSKCFLLWNEVIICSYLLQAVNGFGSYMLYSVAAVQRGSVYVCAHTQTCKHTVQKINKFYWVKIYKLTGSSVCKTA